MYHSHSCQCCMHQEWKRRYDIGVKALKKAGYNHHWTDTGDTRERWWFFGKRRIQKKQVKIGFIEGTGTPIAISKWKTTEVRNYEN